MDRIKFHRLFVIAIGLIAGIVTCHSMLGIAETIPLQQIGIKKLLTSLAFAIILILPSCLYFSRLLIHKSIDCLAVNTEIKSRFIFYDAYLYSIFLTPLIFLTGISPTLDFFLVLFALLLVMQLILFIFSMGSLARDEFLVSFHWLAFLFLISGFSALIYQIVWQRTLFAIFGIDIASVTIIVSIFMFGLGAGALLGGILQRKFPRYLLQLFFFFEVTIGLYGLASMSLFSLLNQLPAVDSLSHLSLYVFLVLAIPTLLMGATLPILVAYLNHFYQNIGKTVALLYAFNTLGAGIAAFLTVTVLFVFFGQHTSILIAALCNIVTALFIYDFSKRITKRQWHATDSTKTKQPDYYLPYGLVLFIAAAIGFIALSQEIIWFRTIGFMTANRPEVFGLILTVFLWGVAAGSIKAKDIYESGDIYHHLTKLLIISTAAYYLAFPIIAYSSALIGEYSVMLAYIAAGYIAFLTGGIFPILSHIGIRNSANSSSKISLIYFFNIIGSVLGPLLTGFILFEYYSLVQNILITTIASAILSYLIIALLPKSRAYRVTAIASLSVAMLGMITFNDKFYSGFLEKLQFEKLSSEPFKTVIENRSGIITVHASDTGDIVYGGGIYDGRINTDPVINSNIITRAYMIAAMHTNPQRVLEIGLSTGSWAKVISTYQPVKELISIEINKGYVDLITLYPTNNAVLTDKRITHYADDGRRWLKNHPEEKFDIIVMNTSYHWRSNITNLLSKEYLELCKRHLHKNGILYYNTTGSSDIIYTAAHVFTYVTQFENFVAASDAPFNLPTDKKRENLLKFVDDSNHPIFKNSDIRYQNRLNELANYAFPPLEKTILQRRDLWLITDDNMATEYKTAE